MIFPVLLKYLGYTYHEGRGIYPISVVCQHLRKCDLDKILEECGLLQIVRNYRVPG